MIDTTPIQDGCSLLRIHEWMIENEPRMAKVLRRLGISARYLLSQMAKDPKFVEIRRHWQGSRPFPNHKQLLILMTIMSPECRIENFDEDAGSGLLWALRFMGMKDPGPDAINFYVSDKTFQLAEDVNVTVVDAPYPGPGKAPSEC